MLLYNLRAASIALSLIFAVASHTSTAQEAGVVASFSGTLSQPKQRDVVSLEINPDVYHLNSNGKISFALVMRAAVGSSLDPGLILVSGQDEQAAVELGPRRPDNAANRDSVALVDVSHGSFEVLVQSEKKTIGPYQLDVLLAGDVNGDLSVDQADLDRIRGLNAVRLGSPAYLSNADIDRNGVINGGDRQRAASNLGAKVDIANENPLDTPLPIGSLSLSGANNKGFNSRSLPLTFSLAGAEFDQNSADVIVKVNGTQVAAMRIAMSAGTVSVADSLLADGRNDISFKAYDTVGRPLFLNRVLWAGSGALTINTVNADGTAFLQPSFVKVSLSDDPSVVAEGVTENGTITLYNVPKRTILIQAKGPDNVMGGIGRVGGGTVNLKMTGLNPVSSTKNLDFSLGLTGWLGSTYAAITPHLEDIPGFSSSAADGKSAAAESTPSSVIDNDLTLRTAGLNEQTISTTFPTQPGTTAIRLRYRFVTTEVPGGFFGSQYNDYFRVSLRSQQGGHAIEANTMNGLGLPAFHFASGSTAWRDETLYVDRAGDTVQVDLAVANVGDGALPSMVVVDFVEEVRDQVVPSLAWNNVTGGLDLTYSVEGDALSDDATIEVYWAAGTAYGNRIGTPIFSISVAAGTGVGSYGPEHIDGALLDADPATFTHFIAASTPSLSASLADVTINYGPNADASAVTARAAGVVKDSLRVSGQSIGIITSTARTPADQARAMYQNLINPANTVAVNVRNQLALYARPGDAVVDVFVIQTVGMSLTQIQANSAAIQSAMVAEINSQGPSNVSRHCADPAVTTVMDVSAAAFSAQNAPIFLRAATARADNVLDERRTNNCFHIEVNNPTP